MKRILITLGIAATFCGCGTGSGSEPRQPLSANASTQDKLWAAFDDSGVGLREDFKIEYDSATKSTSLTRAPKDAFTERSFVKDALKTFVRFGAEAFKVEGVEDVEVDYDAIFTDSFGKSDKRQAVSFGMQKIDFLKYEWKGLSVQPVSKQFKQNCSVYFIHPSIRDNIPEGSITYP